MITSEHSFLEAKKSSHPSNINPLLAKNEGFFRPFDEVYATGLIPSPEVQLAENEGYYLNSEIIHNCGFLSPNQSQQLSDCDYEDTMMNFWSQESLEEAEGSDSLNLNTENIDKTFYPRDRGSFVQQEEPVDQEPMNFPSNKSRPQLASSKIIAKPASLLCCGLCEVCGKSTIGIVNTNNPQQGSVPICILFLIFLVVSVIVISGIMLFLKAGRSQFSTYNNNKNKRLLLL